MLKNSSTPKIIVIGKEGVGKSQLISSLTGKYAERVVILKVQLFQRNLTTTINFLLLILRESFLIPIVKQQRLQFRLYMETIPYCLLLVPQT